VLSTSFCSTTVCSCVMVSMNVVSDSSTSTCLVRGGGGDGDVRHTNWFCSMGGNWLSSCRFVIACTSCIKWKHSVLFIYYNAIWEFSIAINDIALKTRFFGLHFWYRKYLCIFNHFYIMCPENYQIRWNNSKEGLLCRSRSFKVTDFVTKFSLSIEECVTLTPPLGVIPCEYPDKLYLSRS